MKKTAAAPARDYSLYFEHRPDYLYVHVEADDISYETTRRYWNEIVAMRHKRHYTTILVDNDVANELPQHDLFTFVSDLAYAGVNGVRFVIRPRNYEADACEFEEMVGTNRGLNLKVCGSIDHAQLPVGENGDIGSGSVSRVKVVVGGIVSNFCDHKGQPKRDKRAFSGEKYVNC